MRKVKVFLSGPMTGIPDFNRFEFYDVEGILNSKGHVILNPAALPEGLEPSQYSKICIAMIDAAECVFMLPGWERSRGAKVEYHYAKVRRIPIFELERGCYCPSTNKYEFPLGESIETSAVIFDETQEGKFIPCFRITVLKSGEYAEMPSISDFRMPKE